VSHLAQQCDQGRLYRGHIKSHQKLELSTSFECNVEQMLEYQQAWQINASAAKVSTANLEAC